MLFNSDALGSALQRGELRAGTGVLCSQKQLDSETAEAIWNGSSKITVLLFTGVW